MVAPGSCFLGLGPTSFRGLFELGSAPRALLPVGSLSAGIRAKLRVLPGGLERALARRAPRWGESVTDFMAAKALLCLGRCHAN